MLWGGKLNLDCTLMENQIYSFRSVDYQGIIPAYSVVVVPALESLRTRKGTTASSNCYTENSYYMQSSGCLHNFLQQQHVLSDINTKTFQSTKSKVIALLVGKLPIFSLFPMSPHLKHV